MSCQQGAKANEQQKRSASTNLAHTAPYCLHTSTWTMAERYHKNEFQNSTVVLPCTSLQRAYFQASKQS